MADALVEPSQIQPQVHQLWPQHHPILRMLLYAISQMKVQLIFPPEDNHVMQKSKEAEKSRRNTAQVSHGVVHLWSARY